MHLFSNASVKRIYGEMRTIEKRGLSGFRMRLKSPEDMTKLIGSFWGCPDSPYESGFYEVLFEIPREYPIKPPKAYFNTKIWHPNISSVTGCVCLSILSSEWSNKENLLSAISGIYTLLISAEPDDPQDAQVAAQFKNNRTLFEATAAFWNYAYAGGQRHDIFAEFELKIQQLINLGYSKDQSIHMLSMKNWDIIEALRNLQAN